MLSDSDRGLVALLDVLAARSYRFVTPTPETHRRVVARAQGASEVDLRAIFGWSRPFDSAALDAEILDMLRGADMLESVGTQYKSRVRISSLGGQLFLHSSFPTEAQDAVFLGPDTYRFCAFIERELTDKGARRLIDLGAGAGVGGIFAARLLRDAQISLLDVNPLALRFARINAAHARLDVETVEGASIDDVSGDVDLVVANPPFILDDRGRAYRDGGSMHGAQMSFDWALASARRLVSGGRMLLYTGSAIVNGRDALLNALSERLPRLGCTIRYSEIDPDIFGEQLDQPGYERVERIAAVGAVIEKP